MAQNLKSIHIEGYKSIKTMDLEIKDLNVLIGANGSGKSNFIGVFKFLRQIIEERLQKTVLEAGSAEKFLHYGSKETEVINISLNFYPNFYSINLKPNENDSLFVELENTGFQQKNYATPFWENISSSSLESQLVKSINKSNRPIIASYVYDALRNWRVYHFHDTSSSANVKKKGSINDNLFLREDAGNLAAFLNLMRHNNPKHYERIVKTIQLVVPNFRDFLLRKDPYNEEMIRLEWLDINSDFIFSASELSDGSLRFICLATMLLQPERPGLILIDEPELGLHPLAINILASLIRKAAHFSQLIVSTQSSDLVSEFDASDIVVVENKTRSTTFTRLDKSKLDYWLQEYSLGEIWDKNLIGGRP